MCEHMMHRTGIWNHDRQYVPSTYQNVLCTYYARVLYLLVLTCPSTSGILTTSAKWGVHIFSKNAEYAHVTVLYTCNWIFFCIFCIFLPQFLHILHVILHILYTKKGMCIFCILFCILFCIFYILFCIFCTFFVVYFSRLGRIRAACFHTYICHDATGIL